MLRLSNEEKAVSEGSFFDLMYVNLEGAALNPHRHYAFLRHHDDTTLFVAVNFGDTDDTLAVNIPRHAFTCLDLPEGVDAGATELLTGAAEPKVFASTHPFTCTVPAHGAAIWKISTRRTEPLRPMQPLAVRPEASAKAPAAKKGARKASVSKKKTQSK